MSWLCRRGDRPRMTTRERLLLTPWEKLSKYGIIPWKFILNISLTIVVTGQILFMNSQESDYLQAQSRNWYFYFFPQDYDFSDIKWNVFTVDDAIDAVTYGVTNFYQINSLSPDTYRYTQFTADPDGDSPTPAGPTLTVVSYTDAGSLSDSNVPFKADTRVDYYPINDTSLGPIDPNTVSAGGLRSFFRSLVSMTVTYPPLDNYAFGTVYRNCLRWSNAVHYDFTNRGNIVVTLTQDIIGTCDAYGSFSEQLGSKAQWLNIAVILLSVLHSLLLIKALVRSARLLAKVRAWAGEQADKLAQEAQRVAASTGRGTARSTGSASTAPSPDLGTQSMGIRLAPLKKNERGAEKGNSGEGLTSGLLDNDSLGLDEGNGGVHGGSSFGLNSRAGAAGSRKGSSASMGGGGVPAVGQAGVSFNIVTGLDTDGGGDGVMITATSSGGAAGPRTVPVMFGSSDAVQGDDALGMAMAGAGVDAATLAAAAEALRVQWSSLPWRERLRFINGWAVLSLVADACNITSSILNLQDGAAHLPHDEGRSLVVGIGASLLWLGLVRYMEHNRNMFNLVLTLRRAAPRVLAFLIGVLPVFVGYCLFATIVFGDRIPRFADIRTSFITLFANLNGDVVRETFMAIVAYHPITGQFFFYTFISLHIYVILNIVIAIVEESYFLTTQRTSDIEAKVAEDKAKLGLDEAAQEGDADDGGDEDGNADVGTAGKEDEGPGAAAGGAAAMPGTGRSAGGASQAGGAPALTRQPTALSMASSSPGRPPVSGLSRMTSVRMSMGTPGTGGGGSGGGSVGGGGASSGLASALALGLDPSLVSPNPDAHTAKAQLSAAASGSSSGSSKLAALLNMTEWDEVVSGVAITDGAAAAGAGGTPGVDGLGSIQSPGVGTSGGFASSRRLLPSPSFRAPPGPSALGRTVSTNGAAGGGGQNGSLR